MEIAKLKQAQTAALIKLTKVRTKMSKIGRNPEKPDALREALTEFDAANAAYHEAHEALLDGLGEDEEELSKVILKFAEHDATSLHFRTLAESWLPKVTPTAPNDVAAAPKDALEETRREPRTPKPDAGLSLPRPLDPRPSPREEKPQLPTPDVRSKLNPQAASFTRHQDASKHAENPSQWPPQHP